MHKIHIVSLSLQKLHVFLFDKAFVLTRPSSRTGTLMYQVLHHLDRMCWLFLATVLTVAII